MPASDASVNGQYGTAVRRREDPPLIQGTGTYTDDVDAPGALHAHFVRSEVAHGRILSIDTEAAAAAPGVAAVFTGAALELGAFPPGPMAPDDMLRPTLARDVVRFQGEAIAVVVAESRGAAVDAAELVEVDFEPLQIVVDPERALDDGAPQLFADKGSNLAFQGGNADEGALEGADVVVRSRFVNQRLAAVPMEPSATVAVPDPQSGGVRVWAPLQAPHTARDVYADALGLEKDAVHVTVPNVGGGFGARIAAYPEQAAVAGGALRLGKPVRYVESRWETMIAMQHGRAQIQDVELGARSDGTLVGIRVHVIADCGAYPGDAVIMPFLTGQMASGVYAIPRVDFGFRCVVTNTTPIGAYRGAGRPEATALVERAMDMFAAEIGMDPAEVRRRNYISDFPHQTVTGAHYDSGDYRNALEKVLATAGYEQLRAEQAARRERGDRLQLGLGLCSYVEWTGFGPELGTCRVEDDGTVTVTSGASAHGQGHETAYAQLVAGTLGVRLADVKVIQSDTAKVARGMGTMGSRSLQVGGTAIQHATDDVLEKA